VDARLAYFTGKSRARGAMNPEEPKEGGAENSQGDDLMVQKIKRAAERKAAAEKLAADQSNPPAP